MTSRLFNTLSAIIAMAVLAGCAASVKYAPRVAGFQPGYVDERLGETTYRVRVGEAWPKDWADLEKFAMYRAAEVTRSNGRRYFDILEASSQTNTYQLPSTAIANTQGSVSTVGGVSLINATTTVTSSGGGSISGGWYLLEFRILSDAEVSQGKRVVDSEQVIRDLRYFIESRR